MSAATAAAVGPAPAPGPWMKMRPMRRPSMNRALSAPVVWARGWLLGASAGCTLTETPSAVLTAEAVSRMR